MKKPNRNPLGVLRALELWEDPAYRAKGEARLRAHAAWRRADPEKLWSRTNTFHGYTREQSAAAWAKAEARATTLVGIMKDKGMVEQTIDPRAEKALEVAVSIMESPAGQVAKLQAARLVLDFTKSKPVAKQEVTVKSAEDFLREIATLEDSQTAG